MGLPILSTQESQCRKEIGCEERRVLISSVKHCLHAKYKRHTLVHFTLILGLTELHLLKVFGEDMLIPAALPSVWGPGGRGQGTPVELMFALSMDHMVTEMAPALTSWHGGNCP